MLAVWRGDHLYVSKEGGTSRLLPRVRGLREWRFIAVVGCSAPPPLLAGICHRVRYSPAGR